MYSWCSLGIMETGKSAICSLVCQSLAELPNSAHPHVNLKMDGESLLCSTSIRNNRC